MKHLKLFEDFSDFDDDGEDEEDVINVETPLYTVYTFTVNGRQKKLPVRFFTYDENNPTEDWNNAIISASRAVDFEGFYGAKVCDQDGVVRWMNSKDMEEEMIDNEYLAELDRRHAEQHREEMRIRRNRMRREARAKNKK